MHLLTWPPEFRTVMTMSSVPPVIRFVRLVSDEPGFTGEAQALALPHAVVCSSYGSLLVVVLRRSVYPYLSYSLRLVPSVCLVGEGFHD
ncbi:hypothetical protein R1flu_019593 [Riccia fluitans]|uniref:Uncharacterized protein n=1 Tax=Riccia fluitans TaxID=41844 RepID=A0ABD1ZJ40_9MARC